MYMADKRYSQYIQLTEHPSENRVSEFQNGTTWVGMGVCVCVCVCVCVWGGGGGGGGERSLGLIPYSHILSDDRTIPPWEVCNCFLDSLVLRPQHRVIIVQATFVQALTGESYRLLQISI